MKRSIFGVYQFDELVGAVVLAVAAAVTWKFLPARATEKAPAGDGGLPTDGGAVREHVGRDGVRSGRANEALPRSA